MAAAVDLEEGVYWADLVAVAWCGVCRWVWHAACVLQVCLVYPVMSFWQLRYPAKNRVPPSASDEKSNDFEEGRD